MYYTRKVVMIQRRVSLIIVTVIILSCAFVAMSKEKKQTTPPANFDEVIYNWSRTFAEVLQITNQKHYKIADPEQCMVKAIDGFLSCLDPHSSFLDPKTYKHIMEATTGEFFGIGIVIDNTRQSKDKYLVVIDTIAEGPADKTGVKPFDKIVEIDGKPMEGMTTDEATAKLKGERNTKVHIKVLREGQPDLLAFDITRDVVKEQSSLAFYIPEYNVSYLSLTSFTENSVKQLTELLKQSIKKQYKGLILDLRNNSGGLLSAAVDICSLFLEKGSLVVTTKDKTNKEIGREVTKGAPIANDGLPIFILINNYTASAGEILAGVLKIHSEKLSTQAGEKQQKKLMVFLVGTKSFGKGSVQEIITVSNNCAMKLTTSLYYLPDDTSIQGHGIEPDFYIEKKFPPTEQMIWFTKYYGREKALNGYIKIDKQTGEMEGDEEEEKKGNSTDQKSKTWSERARAMLESDNQLRDTISLINMLYTAKASCSQKVSTRKKAVEFLKGNFITNDKLTLVEVKV